MKNIRSAFHEFWNGFYNRSSLMPEPVHIPAFQSGYAVFRDIKGKLSTMPQFPYITYDIVRPGFLDFTVAAANIWDRNTSNPGFFGLVDDVLAQAAEKIPEGGTLLDVGEDGKLWIFRNNPFVDYLSESAEGTVITDPAITRGIIRIIVKNYVL